MEELVPDGKRLLVIAPHPDDEVLGSGALLYLAGRAGREIAVMLVTDGSASHPGSSVWPPERLGPARVEETCAALHELGIEPGALTLIGLADGRLARQQAELSRAVVRALRPDDVVVTPWRYDGHPDHEITAQAVVRALQVQPVAHLEVPIWGLHWARPDGGVLPWSRTVRLPVDPAVRARKEAAVARFTSQLYPDPSTGRDAVVPCWALERLVSDDEVFFR
jgi:LmbE family N-acetylglucosaminyl deacetylase